MKILSMIFMALSWFTSGFFLTSSIFWSIEEEKKEMIRCVIRTICFAAVGIVWILLIYARYMT